MKDKVKILINLLVVVVFVYLYTQLDYQSIMNNLKKVPLWVLVVMIALQLADMLLVTYQNKRLTAHLGYPISFAKMNFVTCMGHVFDAVTPGGGVGGEAVKIMMLKRYADVPMSIGSAAMISQKVVSACTLLMFATCAFFYMTVTATMNMPLSLEIAIYVGLVSVLGLLLYVFYHPRKFIDLCAKLKNDKVRESLIIFLEGVEAIGKDKMECIKEMSMSLFIWFIFPFKLYIILEVIGIKISFLGIYAVIFLSYAMAMLPIFPGGMLGFEVAMTSMLALYGVGGDDAIFVATLFRIITFWFVILISIGYSGVYKMITTVYRPKPKRDLK